MQISEDLTNLKTNLPQLRCKNIVILRLVKDLHSLHKLRDSDFHLILDVGNMLFSRGFSQKLCCHRPPIMEHASRHLAILGI